MSRSRAESILALVASLAAGAPSVRADEAQLQRAFEGRPVQVLLDLPASSKGFNLYPGKPLPYDRGENAGRLVSDGVGVREGSVVTITKIKAKKDLIEVHFAAGGESQKPSKASTYVGKSELERELEKQIEDATSEDEKKRLRRMLASERSRRQQQERLQQTIAEQQYQQMLGQRSEEEWDLLAGSRINVRYDGRVPTEVLTPEGLRAALAGYVEFDPPPAAAASMSVADAGAAADPAGFPIWKGQSQADLGERFGAPQSCREEAQGVLTVSTCTYRLQEATLEASFVDGVMVRYVLTSN